MSSHQVLGHWRARLTESSSQINKTKYSQTYTVFVFGDERIRYMSNVGKLKKKPTFDSECAQKHFWFEGHSRCLQWWTGKIAFFSFSLLHLFLPTLRHVVIYTFGTNLSCSSPKENGNYDFHCRATEKVVQLPPERFQLLQILEEKGAVTGLISSAKWCLGKHTHLLSSNRPGNLSLRNTTHWSHYGKGHSWVAG